LKTTLVAKICKIIMAQPNVLGIAVLGAVAVIAMNSALHKVEEGHVAVYYRGGALLETLSHPGFHMKTPFSRSLLRLV
jgi:regulator of protease activity HflC (stomatin/prohibitin superfamily)